MSLWHDGYLADAPYPHLVQPELAPSWMVATLTALGRSAPDLSQGFRYCELGCGQGLGSLLLAAANPAGEFVAVDFNPRHIAHGRDLATRAGLGNLRFVEAAFDGLAGQDLGEGFDFIVLHGVYSWVSPANRAAIRSFIQQRLRPGGVAYLGYMTEPGLSAFRAAQRFIWKHARQAPGTPTQRLRSAFAALRGWQAAGAGYFVEHPDVARRLDAGEPEDLAQLAHELLCEHWEPLPVAQVMGEFAAIGLDYAGSAVPLENIDALSVPGACLPLLEALQTTEARETAKDLARNQSQRRDLYQRAGQALAPAVHRQALLEGCWAALPGAPTRGGLRFDTRIGPVEGEASLFSPLLQALAEGPQGFAELARRPALAPQLGQLNRALQMLTWAGHAHPLTPGPVAVEAGQRLNRLLAEGALAGAGYRHLVAPSLGASIPATAQQMALARVLLELPGLRGGLLRETGLALLRREGWQVQVDDAQLNQFEHAVLPVWRQLGVVP